MLGWAPAADAEIEDGSGPAAGVGISSAPGGWARVVYTTQGKMLQGYLIVRGCAIGVREHGVSARSTARICESCTVCYLILALKTTMFDESIPFLSAENARPPSGSRSTINPNYATQKPRASQKRTGYRPTEISKVKRARSCRACSVALRWQGAANIYTQHMHAVHGHGRRAAAARRTARARRETHQY